MEDKLIEVLSKLNYPVFRQGSLLPHQPYPRHFFTFWNDSADGNSFYDNDENSITWAYSVNFYSVNPAYTYEKLTEIKSLLKENGFIVTGGGYDVASDEPTHTGRGISVFYKEIKEVKEWKYLNIEVFVA